MSYTLEERIAKSKERTAKLEQQRRIEMRKRREAQKKKDQSRNYYVGEMVVKYFPEIMCLEVGTKAENMVRFQALEAVLATLADDKKLMKQLKEQATRRISQIENPDPCS